MGTDYGTFPVRTVVKTGHSKSVVPFIRTLFSLGSGRLHIVKECKIGSSLIFTFLLRRGIP